MARPRKQTQGRLSPGQASYVLDRAIGDRKLSWTDIHRYTEEMKREITHLEERLHSLREAAGDAIRGAVEALRPGKRRGRPPASAKAAGAAASTGAKRRRRSAITAEQLASRQLQGRYLGLIRQIPASRRAQYQRIAKEKGREAAIKEMQSVLSK